MTGAVTRLVVVESGAPVVVSGLPTGERTEGLGLAEIPAVVDRVAAALDFLRSQQIAHGPVDVDDVRVRRNELRVITCVELIVPAGDSVPTVESDVANLGQFAAAIGASAPHYSAIAVAAASGTERYPDCWTLAARLSAAVAPPPGNWPTPPATPRRSRGWLIAAALAAVVLVVAGGTVAGLLLTGGSSNDDGPSAADLPRQDLLLKNPDGVKVGSWTAVSMGTAPEWGVPTVCGLSDKKVYCRSPWSPVTGQTSGESRNEFVRIQDVDDVTDLSGGYPVCIVTAGSAACWGGPPGVNGAGADAGQPGRIPGLRDVAKVAGGETHACASDGHGVYCWGDPRYEDALAPVDTVHVTVGSGLTDVEAMAAGDHHLCAIAEQRLWCWGKDDEGQLGVGDNGRDFSDAPLPTVGLGRVQAVTAGGDNTCAVSDGRVYCWGARSDALGFEATGKNYVSEPHLVDGMPGTATTVATATDHSCAVVDAKVFCWGNNNSNQLGIDTVTKSHTPVQVPGLTQVSAVSVSERASCAINAGNLYCWGSVTA